MLAVVAPVVRTLVGGDLGTGVKRGDKNQEIKKSKTGTFFVNLLRYVQYHLPSSDA